jgi:hypothetical protein
MKKQYRFGIALSLRIAGDYPAKISKLLYQQNEGLDFDYDGIVCENELLQNNLNPSTKSTTTTPSPVVSVTTIAPVATSPQYVQWRTGSSAFLRSGFPYIVTFGWIVTEAPGQVTRMRLRGFSNPLEMTVVISN